MRRTLTQPLFRTAMLICSGLLVNAVCFNAVLASEKSDREKEGLIGKVHTVVTKASPHLYVDAYDPEGQLLEHVHDVLNLVRKDPFPARTVYTYDAKGRRTSETLHGNAGFVTSVTTYSIDLNGNTTKTVTTSKDGSSTTVAFLYDDRGNKTRITGYRGDKVFVDTLYGYDTAGNRIKEVYYRDGGIESDVRNSYDTNGRLIEQLIYAADGGLKGKRVLSYDKGGNKSTETSYEKNGSVLRRATYSYENDSIGNWIKESIREWLNKEGQLVPGEETIIERVVTYYREDK